MGKGEERWGMQEGGIQDDDRGFRREVKEDGEWGMERKIEVSSGGEEVRKRAGDCAGRRGEGRVSGDTVFPL